MVVHVKNPYLPITDWSKEGRRALVAAHEQKIKLYLDEAFTTFLDNPTSSLEHFGFGKKNDAISEAVNFCLDRFVNGDIDPQKLHAHDRSFRLFTRVHFWLAQKVGAQAFSRLIRPQRHIDYSDEQHSPIETHKGSVEMFIGDLACAMPCFQKRNNNVMVQAWLEGASKLLTICTGAKAQQDAPLPGSSKARSMLIADALFRFLNVYFKAFTPAQLEKHPSRPIYDQCTCSPFDNDKNHRRDDRAVAKNMNINTRDVTQHRKDAVLSYMDDYLTLLDERRDLETALIKHSLRVSILHVHRIEDEDYKTRLRALKQADPS